MVDGINVIWVEESLPPGMATQKVELITSPRPWNLEPARKLTSTQIAGMPLPQPTSIGIYDKRTAHIRGNQQEVLDLLDVLMKSATVSIHCPGCAREKTQ